MVHLDVVLRGGPKGVAAGSGAKGWGKGGGRCSPCCWARAAAVRGERAKALSEVPTSLKFPPLCALLAIDNNDEGERHGGAGQGVRGLEQEEGEGPLLLDPSWGEWPTSVGLLRAAAPTVRGWASTEVPTATSLKVGQSGGRGGGLSGALQGQLLPFVTGLLLLAGAAGEDGRAEEWGGTIITTGALSLTKLVGDGGCDAARLRAVGGG